MVRDLFQVFFFNTYFFIRSVLQEEELRQKWEYYKI